MPIFSRTNSSLGFRQLKIPGLVLILMTLRAPSAGAASGESHPCSEITRKCREIGYGSQSSIEQKRNLIKNCLEKVVHGQTIPGINLPLTTISACQTIYNKGLTARRGVPSESPENHAKRPNRRIASDSQTTEIEPPKYDSPVANSGGPQSGTH